MEKMIKIILGPLLLVQGLYVRRFIPRLPEPAGAREGEEGTGKILRLLIAGDSAAVGVGVSNQEEALAHRIVGNLEKNYTVQWKLIAKTGAQTANTINYLEKQSPETFDIALISLGVNDITSGTDPEEWIKMMDNLKELLKNRYRVRHIICSVLPPMRLFPSLPQPLRWFQGLRAERFNRELKSWVDINKDLHLVEPVTSHDTSRFTAMIAEDGFHPGPELYRLWGDSAAEIIRKLLGEESN